MLVLLDGCKRVGLSIREVEVMYLKCIGCGEELHSKLSKKRDVCSNCVGDSDMGLLSREYSRGFSTFDHIHLKKKY
ncbi:hypothetical protein ISS07_00685 [Candidatus Woesearchaeota archaeon]|nr:hypothetical protein [Candidatus Woesearchaeota archaeon]